MEYKFLRSSRSLVQWYVFLASIVAVCYSMHTPIRRVWDKRNMQMRADKQKVLKRLSYIEGRGGEIINELVQLYNLAGNR